MRAAILVLALATSAASEAAIEIELAGPPCTIDLNGEAVDSSALYAFLDDVEDKAVTVNITAEALTRWRCVGGPIFVIQQAGFENIRINVGEGIEQSASHPEASPFDEARTARVDVALALGRAALTRKRVILVLGANWCHDSRGLAGWFETPRFAEMLSHRYEIVYVDVGHPQRGEGRNLDIAETFGIAEITGTPTVLLLSPEGALLNADTARTWNDAASRAEDDIFAYFSAFEPEGAARR
ncbi:thioredoxin family protein [Parasphingopyxis marina]|uniref:Thioredoxin family protein n=1 Tax=Parasphingopyxis marina TaxID=2761622 RepID=A0A842HT12_9SPHN|nr:thioredoxin family protein [Parasphingopyxis marina]MBC2776085.1 thioredoxin family protein [Parasphingopyxis marina]